MSRSFNGNLSNYLSVNSVIQGYPFSVVAAVRFSDISGGNCIFSVGTDNDNRHNLRIGGTSEIRFDSNSSTETAREAQTAGSVTLNKWSIIGGGTNSGGTSRFAFLDGEYVEDIATVANATLTNTFIGKRHASTAALNGDISWLAIYKDMLTEAQADHILASKNPFAVPSLIKEVFVFSGGKLKGLVSGTTLTLNGIVSEIDAQYPGPLPAPITENRILSPGSGTPTSVVATKQSLLLSEKLASVGGALNITATAATFNIFVKSQSTEIGVRADATKQSLTLTGNNASVTRKLNVPARKKSLLISPKKTSISRKLIVSKEDLSLTGNQANITITKSITISTQSLTTTEQNAGLSIGANLNVVATKQSIIATENKPAINFNFNIKKASLGINSQFAFVNAEGIIPFTKQSLTLSAFDPTITRDVLIETTTQSLSLTDINASTSYDLKITTKFPKNINVSPKIQHVLTDLVVNATSQRLTVSEDGDLDATVTVGKNISVSKQSLSLKKLSTQNTLGNVNQKAAHFAKVF